MSLSRRKLAVHRRVDQLERHMVDMIESGKANPVNLPLTHTFTPGLYTRTIHMPAGTMLTSKIHLTEHPFVVHSGEVYVRNIDTGEVDHIVAPYMGVTHPNTRRLLYIARDTVWSTFHPLAEGETGEADLPKIEERIIERRELSDGFCAFDEYRALLRAALGIESGARIERALAGVAGILTDDSEGANEVEDQAGQAVAGGAR